jgi:hypothetical protein
MRNGGAPEQEHDLLYAETGCSVSPRLHRLGPQEAQWLKNNILILWNNHLRAANIRFFVSMP